MIIEIIVLAMASTIRPTSLAAIYALLAHESRRALMLAYVIGGLALFAEWLRESDRVKGEYAI